MKNPESELLLIRRLLLLFIILLCLSGITAFCVESCLALLKSNSSLNGSIGIWIDYIYESIVMLNSKYPFVSYGYDWLAFGHIVIALFFWGAYKDPIKNKWVIEMGMIACLMVLPTAFIAGFFRRIPILWQIVDCSFGVMGFLLLYFTLRKINKLKTVHHALVMTLI